MQRVALVGKMARYLKRLILLPWNFAKLYQTFYEQHHATRELVYKQKLELHWALNQEANQLRAALTQQGKELRSVMGAQLNELRAEITRAQTQSNTARVESVEAASAPRGLRMPASQRLHLSFILFVLKLLLQVD